MMNYDRRKEKTKNAKHVLGRAATLTNSCLNCENFRYFEKEYENIVWCDLMFENYQVSMELFVESFETDTPCEYWEPLQE